MTVTPSPAPVVDTFDVIVAGLGAMGSAAAYHLAKAGQRVLGLDRFEPPHTLGSSHGQSRIIREAYFEHPAYVPLVQRAYELWSALEAETGCRLFQRTGGLMIGAADGTVVSGATRSAEQHRLAHEVLSAAQVQDRFPAFQLPRGMSAVWEPRAGVLFPEDCIRAHLLAARRAGVELRFNEPVRGWFADEHGVRIETANGTWVGRQLLCTVGAWIQDLMHLSSARSASVPAGELRHRPGARSARPGSETLPELGAGEAAHGGVIQELNLPLGVERQVLFWFEARRRPELFQPDRCPVSVFEFAPGRFFYGFPELGQGIKVARHHEGLRTHPDRVDREVRASEVEEMRAVLSDFLPEANGPLRSTAVCLYTNSPDGHFVIGRHPRFPRVLLASPCSGHGFKFSSAIGEVLADLLVKGASSRDLSLFQLARFQ